MQNWLFTRGSPHVFTGKYKVLAAKEIYCFLEETAS